MSIVVRSTETIKIKIKNGAILHDERVADEQIRTFSSVIYFLQ